LARATGGSFPITPQVRTRMASLRKLWSSTPPVNRFIAKIQSAMYRLPSCRQSGQCPINNPRYLQLTLRLGIRYQSNLTSIPIIPTSSKRVSLSFNRHPQSISSETASSRGLRARHLSHNARPAFAFSRCSQRSDSSHLTVS